jgi:Cu+-exporting ATPase
MVGSGVGASQGILIKGAAALERLAHVAIVAFDKTGTITEGAPTVTDAGTDPQVLALAAAVAQGSNHPLSVAIARAAQAAGVVIPVAQQRQDLVGRGASAQIDGARVLIGNLAAMHEAGVDTTVHTQRIADVQSAGQSIVIVARDTTVVGVLGLSDRARPEAQRAVAALHQMGIRTVMISGDNQATAAHIAAQVGIDEVIAEVLPAQKVDAVTTLQLRGVVAMVGDGINDAPALAKADVGVAMGSGTDVAIETADAIMMRSDVAMVPRAIQLGRATLNTIRWNLFWAFAYNVIGIPIAAGLLYPWFGIQLSPIVAAAAMAFSSIFVVTNSLRLRGALGK